MSDQKEKLRKEYGKDIKELVSGVMFTASIMNAVDEGCGFAFIDLILEELEKISGRKVDPVEDEKPECEESEAKIEKLQCVKAYKIADLTAIKDTENAFQENERFVKEQLAKAVMERMSIETTWDCIGNVKSTASIKVQKC